LHSLSSPVPKFSHFQVSFLGNIRNHLTRWFIIIPTITITIGDRGAYSRGFFRRARAQDHAQDDAIWDFWVDVEGNKSVPPESSHNDRFVKLDPFVMRVQPAEPARLAVVARQPMDEENTARYLGCSLESALLRHPGTTHTVELRSGRIPAWKSDSD